MHDPTPILLMITNYHALIAEQVARST